MTTKLHSCALPSFVGLVWMIVLWSALGCSLIPGMGVYDQIKDKSEELTVDRGRELLENGRAMASARKGKVVAVIPSASVGRGGEGGVVFGGGGLFATGEDDIWWGRTSAAAVQEPSSVAESAVVDVVVLTGRETELPRDGDVFVIPIGAQVMERSEMDEGVVALSRGQVIVVYYKTGLEMEWARYAKLARSARFGRDRTFQAQWK